MSKAVRRGYVEKDEIQFGVEAMEQMKKAAYEIHFFLNQGYDTKSATTFVGNHYLLSERQRLALARSIAPDEMIESRRKKQISLQALEGKEVVIDGFNTIITLEVALSGSLLLQGMDHCIRDLAGLRGTYRIIEVTEKAVDLILDKLAEIKVSGAIFYLDAPVSNSGRLKGLILELAKKYELNVSVEVVNEVDRILERSERVITSDAIILNRCNGWINLNEELLGNINEAWCVDLTMK
ncbi:hypothetical protein lbkm_2311 [Lachnospiraceae bacterium KM106-2]|nr:hypothetical protein lbkm_2311 [Lachnospiraceae bacterium KM106-2]